MTGMRRMGQRGTGEDEKQEDVDLDVDVDVKDDKVND